MIASLVAIIDVVVVVVCSVPSGNSALISDIGNPNELKEQTHATFV